MKNALLLLCVVVFTLPSCVAFHHRGGKDVNWQEIETRGTVKEGMAVKEVVELFGRPDLVQKSGEDTVWVYRLFRSFYIVVFGQSEWKDLIITLGKDGKVKSHTYFSKGETTSVFIPPVAVQNE